MWIMFGVLVMILVLLIFYRIVEESVINSENKKKIVKEFVLKNENLTLKKMNVNFHRMYNSMDKKLKNVYTNDMLWQHILNELGKK